MYLSILKLINNSSNLSKGHVYDLDGVSISDPNVLAYLVSNSIETDISKTRDHVLR